MKLPDTSTAAVSPATTICAAIVPVASGARFGTITENDTVPDSPPGSRPVTVTCAAPGLTAVTATDPDLAATVATLALDEWADSDTISPFSSLKHTGTLAVSPTWTVCDGMPPQDTGAAGGAAGSPQAPASTTRANTATLGQVRRTAA